MIEELLPYYNEELAYLRELGAEFAASYPAVAGRLAIQANRCADPHVERLLEGVAFLTARVRRKIEDEFPEITEALLGRLDPGMLRPVPSLTIAQFVPVSGLTTTQRGTTIARGSRLRSRALVETTCHFSTAYPVTLWPVEVESARLDTDRLGLGPEERPASTAAVLRLRLRVLDGETFSALSLDRLRFHIDGPGALPFELYELLFDRVIGLQLKGKTADGRSVGFALPPEAIEPVGFSRAEGLIDIDEGPDTLGGRLLREYFAFPEKFLFFDLTGLERLAELGFGEDLEVLLFLDRAPRECAVRAENFRLGCTPVVNLFAALAEPIVVDQTEYEYRVVPDVDPPSAAEVYCIDSVHGRGGPERPGPVVYEQLYAAGPPPLDGHQAPLWHATRRPSRCGDPRATEVGLVFVHPDVRPDLPARETVTAKLICSNRSLPTRLPFGGEEGVFELEGRAPVARVRCLRQPTQPVRPPLGPGVEWRLVSLFTTNHLSLIEGGRGAATLRELLALHDLADSEIGRQQIAGVVGVSGRRIPVWTGRGYATGVEVTIEFDESHFVGRGVFLMASVLERFLGLQAPVNSFSRLVLRTRQREGVVKRWPPRSGERGLL